ncbi:hypothetical protein DV515_00001995, partial [Chloebia gouldiae]
MQPLLHPRSLYKDHPKMTQLKVIQKEFSLHLFMHYQNLKVSGESEKRNSSLLSGSREELGLPQPALHWQDPGEQPELPCQQCPSATLLGVPGPEGLVATRNPTSCVDRDKQLAFISNVFPFDTGALQALLPQQNEHGKRSLQNLLLDLCVSAKKRGNHQQGSSSPGAAYSLTRCKPCHISRFGQPEDKRGRASSEIAGRSFVDQIKPEGIKRDASEIALVDFMAQALGDASVCAGAEADRTGQVYLLALPDIPYSSYSPFLHFSCFSASHGEEKPTLRPLIVGRGLLSMEMFEVDGHQSGERSLFSPRSRSWFTSSLCSGTKSCTALSRSSREAGLDVQWEHPAKAELRESFACRRHGAFCLWSGGRGRRHKPSELHGARSKTSPHFWAGAGLLAIRPGLSAAQSRAPLVPTHPEQLSSGHCPHSERELFAQGGGELLRQRSSIRSSKTHG